MILKAYDETHNIWIYIDNIRKIKVESWKDGKLDPDRDNWKWEKSLVDLNEKSGLFVFFQINKETEYTSYIVGEKAYLLNDEGKTIERI